MDGVIVRRNSIRRRSTFAHSIETKERIRMKNKDKYKYLVTFQKGTDIVKYHYYSMEDIEHDLMFDLKRFIDKGYSVTIDKL